MQFYTYIYRDPSRLTPSGYSEPFYVGKGKENRAFVHLIKQSHSPAVANRISKMKQSNIDPLIEIINAIDESHAFFLESCMIEVIGRRDLGSGPLLNLTAGGDGGTLAVSNQTREKIAQSKRGKPRPPHVIEALCAANKGKKRSPQSIIKQLETQKTSAAHAERMHKLHLAQIGKPRVWSEEHRQNMLIAQKNKVYTHSTETRQKMSESHKGKKKAHVSVETRQKMSDAKKSRPDNVEHMRKLSALAVAKKQKCLTNHNPHGVK